jgi:CHAD domain-containing protein
VEDALMAFRFDPDRELHPEIHRIVEEECLLIHDQLMACDGKSMDKSIHESRKAFKRLRALLRLVRPVFSDQVFTRLDNLLRQMAKRLGAPRDAYVMIRSWDRLAATFNDPLPFRDDALARRIRGVLVVRYLEAIEETVEVGEEPRHIAAEISAFEESLCASPWWPFGIAELEASLAEQFDECRRRWKKVRRKPTEKKYHQLRRDAKYFLHHLELASAHFPDRWGGMEKKMSKMVDALGEDHDYAVLWTILESEVSDFADADDMKEIRAAIRKIHKRLQKKAIRVGERVFDKHAEAFKDR